jgi:hypothetical protein
MLAGIIISLASVAQAEVREIKILKQWGGRVDNAVGKKAPSRGYIAGQEELDQLWAAWKIPGKSPKVDFKTRLVLVQTCNCSHISIAPLLNEKGNLHIQVTVTKDITEDTAYVLALISRRGIRSFEGKPLGANR